MSDKPIIDEKRKDKFKALLDSREKENINLVVNIVDKCDIEKSFPMILELMAACPFPNYTMNTPFVVCQNFYEYVSSLIHDRQEEIPTQHSIQFIMDLWERHNKMQIIKEDIHFRKKLLKAYAGIEVAFQFKPNLNPKKNVK